MTQQTNTARPAEPTTAGPVTTVAPGAVARQEFGAQSLAVMGDVGAQRAEAEARALVQARYVMALQRPRDWDEVRVRLMREVERPGFAAVAYYRKPVGKGVEGLSVRFAEAAARCMGNLLIEPETRYEDASKRVLRITATDLESNLTTSLDVVVEKTVERTSLADGRVAISMRKNSENKLTYLVPATEDEMLGKVNSLIAKARRNLVLQILPGDIADGAKARILAIRNGEAAKDPDGYRKKVIDSFALLNVFPADLKRYLGHDVSTASPMELADLRDLYSSIAAGEATWAEALAEKIGGQGEEAPAGKAGLDGVTERLEKEKPAAPVATAPAAAAQQQTPTPAAERPKVDPKTCAHRDLPTLKAGEIGNCPECGAEVIGEPAREPGSDDEPPAPPAVVEDIKNLAGKAGPTDAPRQRRLKD